LAPPIEQQTANRNLTEVTRDDRWGDEIP